MPFDGSSSKGVLAVYMIDRMFEVFDEGKHWCRGWNDNNGGHCIVGAMISIRATDKIRGDGTSRYIVRAIREDRERWGDRSIPVMYFNDHYADWPRIAGVLRRARELALADAEVPISASRELVAAE